MTTPPQPAIDESLSREIARAARSGNPLRQLAILIAVTVALTVVFGTVGTALRDGAPPAPPPVGAASPKLAPAS